MSPRDGVNGIRRKLLARIDTLTKERRTIAAELAATASTAEIFTLHPASIERYAKDVTTLADMVAQHGELPETGELVSTLRPLIAVVIVHAEPNAQGFAVEVKGRLAEITGNSAFPSRSRGGGEVVARDRYRLSPHDANLRYFLRSSA